MERPRLVVCGQASLDGKITTAPGILLLHGDERWQAMAGEGDGYRAIMEAHRPQAFLEGSGSFMPEGGVPEPLPPLSGEAQTLYRDYLPEVVVQRAGHRGWFTVVDGRGRVRWVYKEYPAEEWRGWHVLVLVARHTPPEYLAYLRREQIPYLVAGEGPVDLAEALAKMRALLGVTSVVSTSPGRLGAALLRAGLVDELEIDFLPAVVGGDATPGLFGGPALRPGEWPVRLELISAEPQASGGLRVRYRVAGRYGALVGEAGGGGDG